MQKTEAIVEFLKSVSNRHLTSLYNPNMEVQVNAAQDDGEKIQGIYKGKRWVGWKNAEGEQWKSFRIPWNAKGKPEYTDSELKFNLTKHVEGIGLTGWDWVNLQSHYVGFDFDSIANHKEGLELEELEKIKLAVLDVPWVTIVKSTSGKGLHLYIHFETPIPTENHTVHAALARSILTLLSAETGYNLETSVDACGGVLWVYHRKQEGTDGLTLLKQGTKLGINLIPKNWRAHIEVTTGKRKQIKGISLDDDIFNQMVSPLKRIDIDDEHRRILRWFSRNAKKDYWWDSDHNMLVCHTFDLRDCHKALQLKGFFNTNSSGSSGQNCYAFPVINGAWTVRRHGLNIKEHPTWTIDPSGWTRCIFNDIADITTSAKASGGVESAKGEFVFNQAEHGIEALKNSEIELTLPEMFLKRQMFIREKGDKLIVGVVREDYDKGIDGFLPTKERWECVINIPKKKKKDIPAPDALIRHVIANDSEAGWYICTEGRWIEQNKSNVSTVLLSQNAVSGKTDVEMLMSKAILQPWELVNIPFENEYPGNRKWNKGAAAFSCEPEEGPCPNWLEVLKHCGVAIDPIVAEHEWCKQNAITNGSEYLLCWIANMFQRPAEPLPYLFFVGAQNTGKSTLHEALSLLFKKNRGYARADNALINQQGFNAEIANSILCVVEEVNLRLNKEASNRIKDWVTGKTISINEKYKTVFDIANTSHWIQCANDPTFCPVFPGDTRITVCRVDAPKTEVPKRILFDRLESEKARFLHLILSVELPEPDGRLAIPCLKTAEKMELESFNMNDLETFIKERTKICYGQTILWDDFYNQFIVWLPVDKRPYWSALRTARFFPKMHPYVKGKMGQANQTFIGNVTLDIEAKDEVFEYFVNTTNARLERRLRDDIRH